MSAEIKIRNLTKRFGKVMALDDITLNINAGEFLVLLGPSGCGKSTLLRCLAGLEVPDEGEIDIAGNLVFSAARGISALPGKRQLGMVFQSYALWPHMTVNDNIGFGLGIQKLPKQEIQDRIEKVLRDLSMADLGERYPSELSGGQQQRVALARLLASKPPVFLMDEPLSNLDARLRMDMRTELKRLHYETGATTVYVTHDQTEAMELATQVAVMAKGRIEQVAPPKQLYHHPATLFVADFVGITPANLLPAQTILENGEGWANIGNFRIPLTRASASEKVVVAIRPEDVELALEPGKDSIEFTVYTVLIAGPELIVQAKRGDTLVTICERRDLSLEIDQSIWLNFNPALINLYDESSGKLLNPIGNSEPESLPTDQEGSKINQPRNINQAKEITS